MSGKWDELANKIEEYSRQRKMIAIDSSSSPEFGIMASHV